MGLKGASLQSCANHDPLPAAGVRMASLSRRKVAEDHRPGSTGVGRV